MTFDEALPFLRAGFEARRRAWAAGASATLGRDGASLRVTRGEDAVASVPPSAELDADDWEIRINGEWRDRAGEETTFDFRD